jgi:hypothetical protein
MDEPDVTQPLDQAAVQLHELFASLRRAGFSRGESIAVIAKTAAELITAANDDDE